MSEAGAIEPIEKRWTSLDLHRGIDYFLYSFSNQFYRQEFSEIPEDQQLRVLRSLESAVTSIRRIAEDEINTKRKRTRARR